ncbi:DUF2252 domain-containing protein [Kitasatospora sp. NPDC048722]|uniref:DUF2252 domain-containing protein n=1 Tax=Kitasatospora sp. NPDC048722 TaxID=3155639 RepID=UPI0033F026A6
MTDDTGSLRGRPHPSPRERAAIGKAARARVPRSSHADFEPSKRRVDPLEILERQAAVRVEELVPIRRSRMTESPFRYYRGAAAPMAADLANTPVTGIRVQLCGDAHVLNFGLFASPERHLVFDVNDFDETLPGPWEWDVKRLAASLAIAGRENGFTDQERADVISAAVRSYREWIRTFAGMHNLDVWYAQTKIERIEALVADQLGKDKRRKLSKALEKARSRDNIQAFEKLTGIVDGERRIIPAPPLVVPIGDLLPNVERAVLEHQIRELIERYAGTLRPDYRQLLTQFRLVDMARKVVGVGSVGTRCWIVLMLGRDEEDPLLIQVKEAERSVLAEYAGESEYDNQGQRVVAGQRLMQAASDIFLGWERATGIDGQERDFYVRQLRDWKGSVDTAVMLPQGLGMFGELCGFSLARAHARSGDRIAIAAYLGGGDSFDRALTAFAESYADQNERDHEALAGAVASGRLAAEAA